MKGLFCKLCGELLILASKTGKICGCGNAMGLYDDNGEDIHIDVRRGDWNSIFVVGIDNNLLKQGFLPAYHGKGNPDGHTFFHQWGSAIIVIPAGLSNDVYKIRTDRYPEYKFWTETHNTTPNSS
jgi:hypothetical protein